MTPPTAEELAARGERGVGRPPAFQINMTQEALKRAAANGILPIEVMLENMRWWHKEAVKVNKQMRELLEVASTTIEPDAASVAKLTDTVKLLDRFRDNAQSCAVDAAPYIHHKLGSMVVKGDADNPLIVQHKIEEARNDLIGRIARIASSSSEDEDDQPAVN